MSQSCESCDFWKQGDLSLKNIGNVGQCVWLLPRTGDFYAKAEHAPFWAACLTHQTASYEGASCGVYRARAEAAVRILKHEAGCAETASLCRCKPPEPGSMNTT